MPRFEITAPDGKRYEVEGPAGATAEQALAHFQSQWKPDTPAAPERSTAAKAIRLGEFGSRGFLDSAAETVGALPDLVARGTNAAGLTNLEPGFYSTRLKALIDRLGQFVSAPVNAALKAAEVDIGDVRRREPALSGLITGEKPAPGNFESTAERAAYGAGRGAADAASIAIPAAGVAKLAPAGTVAQGVAKTLASAPVTQAVAGATGGAVGEATDNPLLGVAASLAVPAVAAAGKRIISPVRSQLNPEEARLAGVAAREGIELSPAQATGSRPLQTMESVMATLPLTAGPQRAQIDKTARQFNTAVLKRAGIQADRATPEVLKANTERLGREFERISSATIVRADDQLLDDLQAAVARYGKKMPAQQREVVQAWVDDILATGDTMPGAVYQQARSDLTKQVQSDLKNDPRLSQTLRSIRDALDKAADRSIPENLQDAWKAARSQWAAKKQIEGAVTTAGNVSPAKLKTTVSAGNRGAFAEGRGELNDLARVGDRFVKEQIPNSGSPERTALIQLLTGTGVGGVMGDPLKGMAVGGASLVLPRIAQMAYNSGPGQAYLTNRAAAGDSPFKALAAILAARGKDHYLSAP